MIQEEEAWSQNEIHAQQMQQVLKELGPKRRRRRTIPDEVRIHANRLLRT